MTALAAIGGNHPPTQLAFAQETAVALSDWLMEHPVIQTEEDARAGKLLVDRAFLCLADLDDERTGRVKPFNEQVATINDEYRGPRTILDAVYRELLGRIDTFVEDLARQKAAEAAEALRLVGLAEQRLRDAQTKEREAKDDAAHGTLDVNLGTTVGEAEAAFRDFQRAERVAARAEKGIHVKIGGGFRRALSRRKKETIVVKDPMLAVAQLGWTEEMLEAIIKASRAFRQVFGELPDGVVSHEERSL